MRRLCYALAAAACLPLAVPADDTKADKKKGDKSDKGTVAVFKLRGALSEKPNADDFPFGDVGGTSLKELVARMNKAADDSKVKAVVLLLEGASVGTAQKEELR